MSAKETSSVELPTQGVGDRLKEAREAKKIHTIRSGSATAFE
jgi:hypothetical protein